MKKILGLAVAALLVMGLVGGGTWAYFSDTETSSNNVLTAGTIVLEFDSGVTTPFNLGPLAPGDNVSGAVDWELENQGSLPGYLYITFGSLTKGENGFEDAETAVGKWFVRVQIDDEGSASGTGQHGGHINDRGCFSNTTFLVQDGDDSGFRWFRHRLFIH